MMKDYSTHTMRSDAGSRMDWIRSSILAGFIATFAMTVTLTVGYLIANALGDPNGGQLAQWFENLSENSLANRVGDAFAVGLVLNVIVGIAWALIYGRFVEPALTSSGPVKGMVFSLLPFAISVGVVFPLMDAGFLGSDLGAGPFPFLGNLALHLVYGAVLGFVYAIEEEHGIPDSVGDRHANATAELGAAYGVIIGGIVGAIGGWLVAPSLDQLADRPVITLAGVLTGAAIGTMLGSFAGMKVEEEHDTTPNGPATPSGRHV